MGYGVKKEARLNDKTPREQKYRTRNNGTFYESRCNGVLGFKTRI